MRIIAIIAGVLILSCLFAAYAFAATRTAESAFLPEGRVAPIRMPVEEPRPLWPGCGEILIGSGTCTVYDGFIDDEWANATVYDVSDTCGMVGPPNEPGSCYLYLMRDEQALYIAVDAVADTSEDFIDACKFHFDDDNDGCWPPQVEGPEGGIIFVDFLDHNLCYWFWVQEDGNCAPDPDCGGWCEYGSYGDLNDFEPRGYGIGISSGHMQYEIGLDYGFLADDDWEIQTYFNLGESCGMWMGCRDEHNEEDYIAYFPCTGISGTSGLPCLWPSLVGVKPDFTFSIEPFQSQVPIGGTLDFAKHFHNNTCQTMTIHDTLYVYKGGETVKEFAYEWAFECEQDLDLCFALQVPEKDMFICWDITIVNSGVAVAGGDEYPFSDEFDVHIEPGHKSEVICPD
jgi:hypothetical protein